MIPRHITATLSIILMTCNFVFVNAQDWIVYNTTNSGLPNNQVQAIAVDKKGVRWIGTANGLASFDGRTWTIYKKENSPLPSSMIRTLAIDNHDKVWVGTDRGLAVFDGNHWTVYNSHNTVFPNEAITTVLCDKKRGNVWIGTEKGLVKFDGSQWIRFDDGNSSLINDHVYSVAVEEQGTVWVGTFDHFQFAGRLNKFDGNKWEIIKLEQKELNSSFPQALVVDQENTLWMGVKGTMGGALVRIKEHDWQVVNSQTSNKIPGGIQSLAIEGNKKWIGNGGGLTAYSGAELITFNSSNSSLPDNLIYSIAIDQRGNKWIGMINGGVAVYREGGVVMDSVVEEPGSPFNIYPNPTASVANIHYSATEKERITISVYYSNGQLVDVIQDTIVEKGTHTIQWNPGALPAGIYLCVLHSGKKRSTKKLFIY